MKRKYAKLNTPKTPHIAKVKPMPKPKQVKVEDKDRTKIIAVDFDGVLHLEGFPYIKTPNVALLDWIKDHRKDYCFILNTCRTGRQLEMAVDWLKEQGIEFDFVNENSYWAIKEFGGDCRKIFADVYIDDKATDWESFLRRQDYETETQGE